MKSLLTFNLKQVRAKEEKEKKKQRAPTKPVASSATQNLFEDIINRIQSLRLTTTTERLPTEAETRDYIFKSRPWKDIDMENNYSLISED